jgi:hypothetical protein
LPPLSLRRVFFSYFFEYKKNGDRNTKEYRARSS